MLNSLSAIMITALLGFYSLAFGADYKDPLTGMEFVLVKGGCFQMWADFGDKKHDKGATRKVCVDDFYIGKYEVTQMQWKTVMGTNPSIFKNCGEDCPVEGVSWDEAEEFARLLNKNYRLPYEAEWEYAARSGGKDEKWAGTSEGNKLGDYAWYGSNSDKRPHPVGQRRPNGLGIYDMSGNVWEWMEDKHFENYGSGRSGSWEYCVIRGGSWNDSPEGLRFVAYNVSRAIETDLSLGFRVAFPAK